MEPWQHLFLDFFTNDGLTDVGANIAKHLSAEDLVACMQAWDRFENFIFDHSDMRQMFVKKAQFECLAFKLPDPDEEENEDPLDYILNDLKNEKDEKKMKLAVQMFKIGIQCFPVKNEMREDERQRPSDLLKKAWLLDPGAKAEFLKEFKKLVPYCTDLELQVFKAFINSSPLCDFFDDTVFHSIDIEICLLILMKLKNRCYEFRNGWTIMHCLAKLSSLENAPSKINQILKTWIQSLPIGPERCPQSTYGQSPLHIGAINGKPSVVAMLCQNMSKDQIGMQDASGWTALHHACQNKICKAEVVAMLCEIMSKDQIGMQDGYGKTALHWACLNENCNAEVVSMLCQNMSKDQIGMQDNRGRTALHYACFNENCKTEVVELLCQIMSKDQIGLQDEYVNTALHYACRNDCKAEVVALLCQNMSQDQIGMQDVDGRTALHLACLNENCKAGVVAMLCQNMSKDQIGIQDNRGRTALHHALENKNCTAKVLELLRQYISQRSA